MGNLFCLHTKTSDVRWRDKVEELKELVNDAIEKIRTLEEETDDISKELREIVTQFRKVLVDDIKDNQTGSLRQFKNSSFIHHFYRDITNKASLYSGISEWKRNRIKKARATHLEEYLKVIRDYLDDGYIKMYPIYIATESFYPTWYVWYKFREEYEPFILKISKGEEKTP